MGKFLIDCLLLLGAVTFITVVAMALGALMAYLLGDDMDSTADRVFRVKR